MRVPPQDVELFLMLGWRLADEPTCGPVLMTAPEAFAYPNRVPINEKAGGDCNRAPAKVINDETTNSARCCETQA